MSINGIYQTLVYDKNSMFHDGFAIVEINIEDSHIHLLFQTKSYKYDFSISFNDMRVLFRIREWFVSIGILKDSEMNQFIEFLFNVPSCTQKRFICWNEEDSSLEPFEVSLNDGHTVFNLKNIMQKITLNTPLVGNIVLKEMRHQVIETFRSRINYDNHLNILQLNNLRL